MTLKNDEINLLPPYLDIKTAKIKFKEIPAAIEVLMVAGEVSTEKKKESKTGKAKA